MCPSEHTGLPVCSGSKARGVMRPSLELDKLGTPRLLKNTY